MKKINLILLIVFFYLQFFIWYGKNNVKNFLFIKKNVSINKNINMMLKDRNDKILIEIDNLKQVKKNK